MGKFNFRFSDLRIKSKLVILIGIFLLSHVLIALVASFLFRTLETLNIVVNEQRVFLENFHKGIEDFYEFEISNNPDELRQANENFDKAYKIAYTFTHLENIMEELPKDEWVALFYDVFGEGVKNMEQVELMGNQIQLLSKLDNESLSDVKETASEAYVLAENIMHRINDYAEEPSPEKLVLVQDDLARIDPITATFTTKMYELNEHVSSLLILVMSILIILLISFATFVSVVISNSIARPINKLVDNFKTIAKGNLKSSINLNAKNELGDLSTAFLEIQNGLQNVIAHSQKVARGNYSTKLHPKSEEDELTIALNKMTTQLHEAKVNTEKDNWLRDGINDLENHMRGNFTVRELSDRIISFLSRFLNVEIGAVYVFDDELEHLEFTGSVGIKKNEVVGIIKPGEGLIGKAAKNESLEIVHTKEKYHKTFSATGEIMPEQIYLLPLHYNQRIQAVIELAPVNSLSDQKIEFLNLIKERVSVNLSAAVARFRNSELLKQTMEQAKILEERDKELSKKLEENNKIQAELVKETALLDSMLKTLPDYIYFKDTESKFLRISESMVGLFEAKSSDEIIGKTDFDFHQRKDAKRFYDEEQKIIKEGKGFIDVIREGIDEDGDELWTSVTKLPLYNQNGKCIGTFGISKDVTNIKKLEIEVKSQNDKLVSNQNKLKSTIERMDKVQAELEREKALMDSLLNNLPDAVYFKDKESKFIKVSKSMPKLFNLDKPEELYGKSDYDFHEKEHATKTYRDEQQIIKTQKPIIGEVEKETYEDGRVRYVSTTKMPMKNEKNEVIGTFGISRDITKIKELELEVQERNNALKVQQEELKATNEELKTQEEELRVANEELAEQTKVLTESEKNLQAQREELQVINEELANKTGILEQQKKQITDKNEDLLRIQNELKQKARELEQASQYKSEFLANMSHELRTPLNSMLILSKLLGNNKKGNLTDEQVKSINIIHKSGNDLLNLINEILDLSKIEAGKMKYEFTDIPVDEVITEIKQNFQPVAESKSLKLEIEQTKNFPDKIYTDKQRMMQIIKNLLSNAFKFTSEGAIKIKLGTPDSSTLFVNERLNKNNTYLIAVEDSGVGIPKDKAEAIFEAFQQADGSISRKFGGTGLGLSISKQLTHVLGGEIHVESTEGKGSVFTVYLPLDKKLVGVESDQKVRQQQPVPESKTSEQVAENKQTENKEKQAGQVNEMPLFLKDDRDSDKNRLLVLIIHNDKEKAQKLIDLSHKRKFNVVVAANISDGIKLAEKYSPQAIIISVEQSNTKELQNLKQNSATKNLPLHVVSKIDDSVLEDIKEKPKNTDDKPLKNENEFTSDYKEVLVVEDDEATREAIQMLFENKDIIIHEATNAQQAYDLISTKPFDSVVLDLGLPDYPGKELLKKLKDDGIPIPNVIINTAKELSTEELRELHKYSDSIVIKGVKSDERLMDEVTLFLHQVENTLPKSKYPINKEDADDEGFKGKKVLIVDDDIRNIFALAQILEDREMEILEAENGQVALEILKNNPDIDLVLMDIMMPVMNGYEAMTEIRKTPEIEDVPIITLTAKAMKEDYQKAIDSGANDYISKPVDTDKLMSLLKIWLFK